MKKGNTALVRIKTNLDLRDADRIEVGFSQKGKTVLIKSGESVMTEEDDVLVVLSKPETSLFEAGRMIPVDVTAYYEEGTQITSNIMYRSFDGMIRKEIEDECRFRRRKHHRIKERS